MKRSSKKVVAFVTASAMILSVAGCSKTNKTDKAVCDAAAEFADALLDNDANGILDLCSEDYDSSRDQYKATIDFSNYGEDAKKAYEAILGTMEYEVDDKSVEVEDDEASVDVIFTMVDYNKIAKNDDDMADVDAFCDAVDASDKTIDVETTFEFEKDEDDFWNITNLDDVLEDVYCFVGDSAISFNSLSDFVDHTYWWFTNDNNNSYSNVTSINCQLYLTEEAYELDESERAVYYTVSTDGNVIYTSETYASQTDAYWSVEMMTASGMAAPESGYLEGTFTITFYDRNNNELASDTCTATVSSAEDASFSIYWWFTSSDHAYNNASEIDCDLTFDDNGNYPVYYTVAYNGSVVYTSATDSYSRYGYYGPEQNAQLDSNGYLPAGTYTITFYSATGTMLVSDSVQVTSGGGTQPNPNPNPGTGTIDRTQLGYQFLDDSFRDLISDVSSGGTTDGYGWWDYINGTICDGYYTTNDTVAFSLLLKDPSYSQSIYYAYYYSTDPSVFNDDTFIGSMQPIYDATISPSTYTDGSYYDIDLISSGNQPGYYFLVVADSSSLNTYYLIAMAGVE